jgi:hypothetical protein
MDVQHRGNNILDAVYTKGWGPRAFESKSRANNALTAKP